MKPKEGAGLRKEANASLMELASIPDEPLNEDDNS